MSVRTLHHYDRIGLLKPAQRSDKGYRYYGRKQLLVLQQILFYKKLGFSLKKIKAVLEDPEFDLIKVLEQHRRRLEAEQEQMNILIRTIDKTISSLQNKKDMMDDKDLYAGFSEEQKDGYRQEVAHRWGKDQLEAAEDRIRQLGKEGWQDHKKKEKEVSQLLADLMELPPSSRQVQEAIALHHRLMNLYYEVTEGRYLGLAQLYVADDRFRAHYEKYRPGLAEFVKVSIEVFCDNGMEVKG